MMGIALGGIGVLSLRTPSMLTTAVVNSLDLSSVLLAVFLVFLFGLTGASVPHSHIFESFF